MKKTAEAVKHHGRHLFLFYLARTLIAPFVGIRMAYSVRREKGPEPPYIILSNHNSDLDPALVTRGIKGHTYFVASEHAFRKGLPSKILAFVFDPIYINKAQPDAYTMKEIFRRLKAGYNVCIFAEGNRSYNGLTGDMVLATAKMVKISGASLLTFRIEGGYFTTPRWGKKWRRGKASGRITGRYSAAELKSMTNDQVLELIKKGIHEDAYERQKKNQFRFRGKDLAEYIETVLYLCPSCKKIGTIHSKGNKFSCSCGLDAEYLETGFLEGKIQGGSPPPPCLPFSTITEWDKWQQEQLAETVRSAGDGPICTDEDQILYKVDAASGISLLGKGAMSISRKEFSCTGFIFPLNEIKQFAIVGRMALIYAAKDGSQYEVYSPHPRSALKYLEIFRILKEEPVSKPD